jgi:hypothetical protein
VYLATTLSLLAAVADLTVPAQASEVKPVQVVVDAPLGCGDADEFFSSLRSRTHLVRPATGDEPHTTLRVRILETRRYAMGELRLVDSRGETDTRRVQGARCDDVVQALALAAAVALDPSVLLPSAKTTPEPEPTAASAPAPTIAPAVVEPGAVRKQTESPLSSDSQIEPQFVLGTALVGSILLSSGTSPGAAIFGRWTPAGGGRLRPTVGIALTYFRNDVVQSPAAVQASLAGLVLTACGGGWRAGVMTVKPCGLVMSGWLSVSGREAIRPGSVDLLWLSAGVLARVAINVGGGFALDLEAGISAPFLRREFYVTAPSQVVEKTPTLSPQAGLGLAYGF